MQRGNMRLLMGRGKTQILVVGSLQHPGILGCPPPLHRNNAGISARFHPRQPPRHHLIALPHGNGKGPQANGSCIQLQQPGPPVQHRRLRQTHPLLRHKPVGRGCHLRQQIRPLCGIQVLPENRLKMAHALYRFDDQIIQMRTDIIHGGRLPTPPGRHRRQRQ